MKSISSLRLFFVSTLIFVIPSAFLSAKEKRVESLEVLQLAPMVVTTSPGDIDILILREGGLDSRYNSIRGILVLKVKPGSIYARCGIKPGVELVSIQGMEFVGCDYSKEKVIEMLTGTQVTTPYFEFEVCKDIAFQKVREGSHQYTNIVRKKGAVQTIRVPVLLKAGTRLASSND